MNALRVSAHADGCTLSVRVHPGARRNSFTGLHDGALKISLTAPPADGRANDALVALLATLFGIARSSIEILAGHTSRSKSVLLRGWTPAEAFLRVEQLLPDTRRDVSSGAIR